MLSTQTTPVNAPTSLFDHALTYAARGWSIIPVIGKKSTGLWKPFQTQPADVRTLRRLFAKKGITGLAVVLGSVSRGLAVRDFDHADAYNTWAAENTADAASLPTVKTARGFHVYGRLDEEAFIKSGDGELRAKSGCYVLLPPSVHPDGSTYSWVNPLPDRTTPLPLLPSSLIPPQSSQHHSSPTQVTQATQRPSPTHTHVSTEFWSDEIERAIASTLPVGPGMRRLRLFDLARSLKAVVPDARPDELRAYVREWHRRALPVIRKKEFSKTWTYLIGAWGDVRRPAGQSFQAAVDAADSGPVPPICDELGYDGALRRLTALCSQLQIQWGDGPFPLGCQKAAEFLGISKTEANELLKTLAFDGVLRLVKKGTKASKKASEWRFIWKGE